MKVYIGPYTRWIGPYQIADKIPFLSDDTRHNIGEWLSNTWVMDVCNWIERRKKRKVKVHIDNYDTWNADHTIATIVYPLLKRLSEHRIGSQLVDDEDVPPHMRHSDKKGEWGPDNWVHYKWDWVLKEMTWTFEQLAHKDEDDNWERFLVDKEYNERIDNGLRLFGKYYRGLWD